MSNIIDGATLKGLQSRLEKEKANKAVLRLQIDDLKQKDRECDRKIGKLLKHIKELTKESITISEHAILQYQRRIELIHPDEIERKIVTEELKRLVGILGSGTFPILDNTHEAIIRDNIIITIQ